MPTDPPPPKDKYQQLKEEYFRIRDENKQHRATIDNYDRELKRKNGELKKANHNVQHLQREIQRSRDTINGFQNLINAHRQLEDTSPGSAAHHPSATSRRPEDAQATPPAGRHSEDEQQDRTVENKSAPQVSSYGSRGVIGAGVDNLMSNIPTVGPPPPKDKYLQLKEEYFRIRDENKQLRATIDNYDRELKRRNGKMNKANQHDLQHESHRPKDFINNLHNLINVHQKLDPKTLSDFSTKTNVLSISEVGERVNALNQEIFLLATTVGEALIHKRYEVPHKELDAAAAESQEMFGEKMTNILIALAQKPEPRVNPLLVQVILQIFMVNFCVSKIQSWYRGDAAIGEFLSAIYNEIHLNEEQAVSDRWRALTRAYTRPSTEKWNKELYKRLQSVLIIASWAPRTPKDEESYGKRFPSIFKAINELRMAIGEKFTSADLDIYVCKCDRNYIPGIMVDVYGDGVQSSDKQALETIVGTTGIGLGKVGEKDDLQIQILLPSEIVLWSTLIGALYYEDLEGILSTKKKGVEITDGANQDGRD